MTGTWNLQVATPFGTHPATLNIERSGDGYLKGSLNSTFGNVSLSDITDNGEGFEATASLEVQGKMYSARLNGRSEGNALEGTIKISFPLAPVIRFTGRRAA